MLEELRDIFDHVAAENVESSGLRPDVGEVRRRVGSPRPPEVLELMNYLCRASPCAGII